MRNNIKLDHKWALFNWLQSKGGVQRRDLVHNLRIQREARNLSSS